MFFILELSIFNNSLINSESIRSKSKYIVTLSQSHFLSEIPYLHYKNASCTHFKLRTAHI